MKKSKYPVFSNGTEFELWMADNCDRCVKASRYNEKTGTYTKFRCAVNREIIMAYRTMAEPHNAPTTSVRSGIVRASKPSARCMQSDRKLITNQIYLRYE